MNDLFDNLFIFEMANNHQGDVRHGLRIVREMAKVARTADIRAGVKLQYRDLDTFIHPDYVSREDVKHIPRFLSTRLSDGDFQTLVSAIRDEGMVPIVTPFDEVSATKCVEHGVEIIKIASCSCTDWPLLTAIAETKKPVIASTGGVGIYEIDKIVSFFGHRGIPLALLHCVAQYPAPTDALSLNFITRLANRYPGVPVGYSGHEYPDDLDVVKVAVSKGAKILERHVGVPTGSITLNAYSSSPDQAAAWVAAAKLARRIGGQGDQRQVSQAEIDSLRGLMRGVFARRAIPAGKEISRDDVFFAMPVCSESQTTSGEFGRYRTRYIASRNYAAGEAIEEFCAPDKINRIREIVHDAQGMLYEAHIVPGEDVQIELSHHYGLEHFRQTGAILISVINRGYCKKLIVVFPGQSHPAHCHKIKEETFQVLWGDLEVACGDTTRRMKPGDKMLVEAGVMHSFRSTGGCVFEEVSTTHQRDDSIYEDPEINVVDPMLRKTLLDEW